jgi:hypothetical protein
MTTKVIELKPWLAIEFEHFVGVRHLNGPWTHVFLKPSGFEIDFEVLGFKVELHANGIEFLSGPKRRAP